MRANLCVLWLFVLFCGTASGQDVFQSRVIQRHYTPEQLKTLATEDPHRLLWIRLLFMSSFETEVLVANPAHPFREDLFDVRPYECERKDHERVTLLINDNQVKLTLYSRAELEEMYRKALKEQGPGPSAEIPVLGNTGDPETDAQLYLEQLTQWQQANPALWQTMIKEGEGKTEISGDALDAMPEYQQQIIISSPHLYIINR